MQLVKLSSIILIVSLIFLSCQDDPTSLGRNFIGNELEIIILNSESDSLNQNTNSYLADSLSFGAAGRILLGNLDYVKSTMLVRFGTILPDSIRTSLENNTLTVMSAEVELRPNYRIGDLTQQFNFAVHKITSDWGSAGFNPDSLALLTYEPNELTDQKEISDSLIKFNVHSDIALEWMNALRGDSLANNYGMIFLPASGTNLIYGFRAFPFIQFENSPLIRFVVQNDASKIDTIIANIVFDVHVPEGTPPQVDSDKLQLIAGLGQRGKLFFDVSKLPSHVNINRAELTLQLDSLNSVVGSPAADSLRVHLFADSSDLSVISNQRALRLRFDGKQFKGDISQLIQLLNSGTENKGMRLVLSNEIDAVDKYVIFGSRYTEPSLRPKLIIYYNVLK
ncbi:hypothetical protein ASZ90_003656 [hydrocarbon metagenome]|uniref:DNRLRE domain-containing protein n=2 Tax=hydrocarbon metagenome TaxID=938273 RepID=A0A0W8G025_9ZZZZ